MRRREHPEILNHDANLTVRIHGLRVALSPPQSLWSMLPVGSGVPDWRWQSVPGSALQFDSSDRSVISDGGGLSVSKVPSGLLLESYCGSKALMLGVAHPYVVNVSRGRYISGDRFRHTVLHSFVPQLLAAAGELILHAAAVVIDGNAFLFSAPSTGGKSTLAAGFAARGYIVLADDVVRVELHGGRAFAFPSYPGIRLRRGSFLFGGSPNKGRKDQFGLPKLRVDTKPCVSDGPYPIAAMYFLRTARSPIARVESLSVGEKISAWLEAGFSQALPLEGRAKENFLRVTSLATAVNSFQLKYKRSPDHFSFLIDEIVELTRGAVA